MWVLGESLSLSLSLSLSHSHSYIVRILSETLLIKTIDAMLGKHNYDPEALPLGCLALSIPLFEFSLYTVDMVDVVRLKVKAFYINID